MKKVTVLIAAIILGVITLRFFCHPALRADGFFTVGSRSMEPTLKSSEIVAIEKDFDVADFRRGDLILFRHPKNDGVFLFKRIIGLPQETVSVTNGIVYIDNQPIDEPYIREMPFYNGHWQVSNGELFVLSDNRNNGSDSHIWGSLPTEYIVGKGVTTCLGRFRLSCLNSFEQITYENVE